MFAPPAAKRVVQDEVNYRNEDSSGTRSRGHIDMHWGRRKKRLSEWLGKAKQQVRPHT